MTQNGGKAVVSYSGFDNTGDKPEETIAPSTTPETSPSASPSASPSPSPTPTRKPSSGGGGGGSYKKPTPTPSMSPTAAPTAGPSGGHTTSQLNKEDHFAYMAGYPDEIFMPDESITRAEVTVMFSRLITEKMDSNKDYSSSFPDVAEDSWYAPQLGFMEQYGIIEGYEDGSFRPENAVTRAEFAVIASKFDRLMDSDENVFTDIEENFWAKPYILLAYKRGWVDGYEDGTFRPYNAITRAEVISIVNRMLERSCNKEYLENNPDEIKTYKDVTDEHWAYYDITEASNAHLYQKTPDEVWTEIAQ